MDGSTFCDTSDYRLFRIIFHLPNLFDVKLGVQGFLCEINDEERSALEYYLTKCSHFNV
jgi:hypothetical protein